MKTNPSSAANKTLPTELLARCQAALGASATSEELMELVMQLLAQELIAAKLQGKAISDNFDIVDRLLRYESLKQRRLNARTRELKAQAKAAEYAQKTQTPSSSAPQEAPQPPVAPTPTIPPPRDRTKPFVLNPVEVGPMPNSEIVPMPS